MDNPDFDSEMVSFDTTSPYFGSEEKLVNLCEKNLNLPCSSKRKRKDNVYQRIFL